jgi:molecular chaperone DnaK
MCAVPELIEKRTGKKPSMEVNPDEAVSLGAAIQGALIQIKEGNSDLVEQGAFPIVEIKDVTAHSLGVIALNDYQKEFNSIILPKNSHIPCKTSGFYHTVSDYQTELDVRVTQGEETDLANGVTIVGKSLMNIPPYPKGAPVEVFFEYNADGMIIVTVFDITAKRSLGEIVIERLACLKEDAVIAGEERLRSLNVG